MKAILIILIILAVLALIYVSVSYVTYKMCFYCKKVDFDKDCFRIPSAPQFAVFHDQMIQLVTELQAKPYKQIFIKNRENKQLAARLYIQNPDAPFDIYFHGWRGNALRDFCGGTQISFELKHNIILVDERGQGKSFGHSMTFGIKEKYDVLDWCNWAIENYGQSIQINLFGVSMGAASVVMAAGLPLPQNVKHIIADCPYSSAKEIIKKVCSVDLKLPYNLLSPFISGGAKLFGHFNLEQKNSTGEEAVRNTSIPVLIIHGDEDLFVPYQMSQKISFSNKEKVQWELFPTAGHGISYLVDTPRYKKLVKEFLNINNQ